MGVVYRAVQLDARGEEVRDVAVKMVLPELMADSGLIYSKRFLRKVRAAAQLRGPNSVTVHDFGQSEAGYLYYVMEWVHGPTLKEILRRVCSLPTDQAVAIGTQICEALHEAHRLAQPIVHRDLKPANVFVERWPDGLWVKVDDFGIAKVVGEDASGLTQTGASPGTPRYMAPEQCLGTAVDGRSDLYALGVVLYETLTGRTPFSGEPMSVMYQHQHTPPPPLPATVPEALCRLIERLLAKSPDERPRDASLVREELGQVYVVERGKEAKEPSKKTTGIVGRAASPPSGEEAAPLLAEANPLDTLRAGMFVGRTSELGRLHADLDQAITGAGRLAMLVGEPGVGKTRTAEEVMTSARRQNVRVLAGRCYEGEGAPAYWPWMQIVRAYIHDREPATLRREMGTGAAAIGQVIPQVTERLPDLPPLPPLDPEQARFRLFDSITVFLKNASQKRPLLLVLDDLHWADKPSLLLLHFVTRALQGSRIFVLGTYRDVEVQRGHPLAEVLAALRSESVYERVQLRGLPEPEVRAMIEEIGGRALSDDFARTIFQRTEGNPFFVEETLRARALGTHQLVDRSLGRQSQHGAAAPAATLTATTRWQSTS